MFCHLIQQLNSRLLDFTFNVKISNLERRILLFIMLDESVALLPLVRRRLLLRAGVYSIKFIWHCRCRQHTVLIDYSNILFMSSRSVSIESEYHAITLTQRAITANFISKARFHARIKANERIGIRMMLPALPQPLLPSRLNRFYRCCCQWRK